MVYRWIRQPLVFFILKRLIFIAPNARFVRIKGGFHVDIFPSYDFNPNQTRLDKNSKPMLTEYTNDYVWISTPKEWTFPLQECIFSGIKTWCPAQVNKRVINLYGELAVNISTVKCINGSWGQSDEYVIAEKMLKEKTK